MASKEQEVVERLEQDVKLLKAVTDDKKMFRHKAKTMLMRLESYMVSSKKMK